MVDHSHVKVGSLYWIWHESSHLGFCRKWTDAKRCEDHKGITFWVARDGYVHDATVIHIGPEIAPPPEPRKPGIYRVRRGACWGAAVYSDAKNCGWMVTGCQTWLPESAIDEISDYLGPLEPPTKEVAS